GHADPPGGDYRLGKVGPRRWRPRVRGRWREGGGGGRGRGDGPWRRQRARRLPVGGDGGPRRVTTGDARGRRRRDGHRGQRVVVGRNRCMGLTGGTDAEEAEDVLGDADDGVLGAGADARGTVLAELADPPVRSRSPHAGAAGR